MYIKQFEELMNENIKKAVDEHNRQACFKKLKDLREYINDLNIQIRYDKFCMYDHFNIQLQAAALIEKFAQEIKETYNTDILDNMIKMLDNLSSTLSSLLEDAHIAEEYNKEIVKIEAILNNIIGEYND